MSFSVYEKKPNTHRKENDNLVLPNSQKRHCTTNNNTNDEVVFLQTKKKSKTECDFLREQMEFHVEFAMRYAEQGNRKMMEYSISRAFENARKVGDERDRTLLQHFSLIRNTLFRVGKERNFMYASINMYLNRASMYATQGNRRLMECCLSQVLDKACTLNGSYVDQLKKKIQTIRESLRNENVFHRKMMESFLTNAQTYASRGNRSLMEDALHMATEHASKISNKLVEDPRFLLRKEKIKRSLTNEKKFHTLEMEKCLKQAVDYARDGNRVLMEFTLGNAESHAKQAIGYNSAFKSRVRQIRRTLVSKPLVVPATTKTEAQQNAAARAPCPFETPTTDDDEILFEKKVSAIEQVQIRLKNAEAAGTVVDLVE